MKILHVLVNYHPSVGGTQIFFKEISERLVNQYHDEVEVVTVNSYFGSHSKEYKKIDITHEVINGVIIKRFSFVRVHRHFFILLKKLLYKIFGKQFTCINSKIIGPWSLGITKAMNNTDADVICASSNGYMFMQYPVYRHTLNNPKPFVYQGALHFSQDHEDNSIVTTDTFNAINASDYYLCNTEYEKERLINLGIDKNKISITGTAVNVNLYQTPKNIQYREILGVVDENEILIGYIGRLESTKSVDVVLYAFKNAALQNNNLKLVIAGFKYDYANTLIQIVNTFPKSIQKKIKFLFNLEVEEKVNLFNSIDIYVSASANESFGMVFLEAWSCKKPVIGASIGAIKSVITEGKDGLLFQPNNIEELANKILLLADNKELRIILGKQGYEKVIENYTWDIVTQKVRNTYVKAIENFKKKNECVAL